MAEHVSVVSQRHSSVGEGPLWDARTNRLLYVDITNGIVSHLDPESGKEDIFQLDGDCVSMVIPFASDPDQLLICRNKQICTLQWSTKKIDVNGEVEVGKVTRINDGKCDCRGRLWAGTMSLRDADGKYAEKQGSFYSFSNNHIVKHRSDVGISNGIAWNNANNTMFYIDSLPRKIYAYDFDVKSGTITNERTLVDFNKDPDYGALGLPDGMTIDDEDKLWVACFDGGCVLRIDPSTGKILRKVSLPVKQITSCCFGGPNYDILYVTSAYISLSDEERAKQPEAGAVFQVTNLGVRGSVPSLFVD